MSIARRAWQAMFEQFVFKYNGDPMPHLPSHQQGGRGRFDPEERRAMREAVLAAVTRTAGGYSAPLAWRPIGAAHIRKSHRAGGRWPARGETP
jgi:hypothetical protein